MVIFLWVRFRDIEESIQGGFVTLIALLWPVFVLIFRSNGRHSQIQPMQFYAFVIFFMFSFLSLIVTVAPYRSAAYVLLTIVTLWVCQSLRKKLAWEEIATALAIYSVISATSLCIIAMQIYEPGTRLGHGTEILFSPNTIGFLCLSSGIASFCIKPLVIRSAVLSAVFVILFFTQSRAAGIGLILGIVVIQAFFWRERGGAARSLWVLGISVMALMAVYTYTGWEWAAEEFFRFNDPYRGLGTGATGRIHAWSATLDLFYSSPIIGVGFRAHSDLIEIASSSHNGYLALLAEIGLFGFLAFVSGVFIGLRQLVRGSLHSGSSEARARYVLTGLVVGYLFVAIFERYLINVGNPTSLIFLFAIVSPTEGTAIARKHNTQRSKYANLLTG